jgi:hypothetical protein
MRLGPARVVFRAAAARPDPPPPCRPPPPPACPPARPPAPDRAKVPGPLGGQVHRGWLASVKETWADVLTVLSADFGCGVGAAACQVVFTGHSRGGGLATIAAAQVWAHRGCPWGRAEHPLSRHCKLQPVPRRPQPITRPPRLPTPPSCLPHTSCRSTSAASRGSTPSAACAPAARSSRRLTTQSLGASPSTGGLVGPGGMSMGLASCPVRAKGRATARGS